MTKDTDPVGRVTERVYAANGIDLLSVHRRTGPATTEQLAAYTYNTQYRPLTVTDAAGQVTTYTYNAQGQMLTKSDALGHTTTYTYNPDGYLASVDGPLPGPQDTTTYTYDILGRTQTWTDVDGYTLTYTYDVFDRMTRITYPDTTYDEWTYDRLDLSTKRDREGRITSYVHNPIRQLVSETDPANRTVRYEWCRCGDMRKLFDPMGRETRWHRDVQGRVTAKEYADGSKELYQYDYAGRLTRNTDPKGQHTDYQRNLDNTLASISYPNAEIFTPTCTYTYDASYNRITKANDGEEDTNFTYHPITAGGTLGAGRLASKVGVLFPQADISYQYDALGRMAGRGVGAAVETFCVIRPAAS